MKTLTIFIIGIIIVIFGFAFLKNSSSKITSTGTSKITATIYKSPTCGCCGVYASYLNQKGYDAQIKNIPNQDLTSLNKDLGVPYNLLSCHTMKVGGYIVEGHVPEEAVNKLLSEKPDIKGIGMAGMPAGSPGMPGVKTGNFVIYEINQDGTQGSIFMTI